MAGFKIRSKVTGLEPLIQSLQGLKQSLRNKILRPPTAKAGRLIARAAKRNAPRRTGLLKKSIGSVVRTYPSGVVVAVVGPRKGFRAQVGTTAGGLPVFADPVKYAHLVELGTVHSPADPFLRRAVDESAPQVRQLFADEITRELEKQLVRARAKGR